MSKAINTTRLPRELDAQSEIRSPSCTRLARDCASYLKTCDCTPGSGITKQPATPSRLPPPPSIREGSRIMRSTHVRAALWLRGLEVTHACIPRVLTTEGTIH